MASSHHHAPAALRHVPPGANTGEKVLLITIQTTALRFFISCGLSSVVPLESVQNEESQYLRRYHFSVWAPHSDQWFQSGMSFSLFRIL